MARLPTTPAEPVRIDTDRGAPPAIRTPRLLLRPLAKADRASYLAALARSRADLERWLPLNAPGESDDAFFDRQLAKCAEGDRSRRSLRRLVCLADGTVAGQVALNAIDRGLSWDADAVWWIDSTLCGRGLATESVRALLDHAMADLPAGLGLHAVHCGIEPGNDASLRVAQKAGFVHQPGRASYLKVGQRWAAHEFYLATPETVANVRDAADRDAG